MMSDVLLYFSNHMWALFPGYAFTILLLMVLSPIFTFIHLHKKNLLVSANITAAAVACFLLFLWLLELLIAYHYEDDAGHGFFLFRLRALSIPILLLVINILLSLSPGRRYSIIWTITMVILCNLSFYIENIWLFITSFLPDYLHTNWSTKPLPCYQYGLWYASYTFAFIVLTLLLTGIRHKYRKH
ncbi:hypothetical protein [Chitinophaga pinensis]|uniref:Uncharacterized protein n=1 Tax=Chitinophaga pinensis (strain ATCC 43595 / DSM 2588 / LMG 13176 / NBRC 15968 / NCIMB 11800 / UQM 2034) TaxID=485918 RepID=A0A979GNY0_CHIPD|nr:hypothetical protein [Chitinophaga pinensis]ACU58878.1 hypothetical protein Cpin_1381 [Chitinophaga pinensis DSM 2588]